MLIRLSIRDIVLIERLDIEFAGGLAVLTGETGAGKSILLDAFALALGARGDAGLVRHGAEQGQVTAAFELDEGHPARTILTENGIATEDPLLLRRAQLADGRTRAFVNDQPVSVQVLKSLGASKQFIVMTIEKEAALISAMGVLLGFGVAVAGKFVLEANTRLMIDLQPKWLLIAALIGVLGGMVGAMYPALRAANLDPVEAISYD